VEGRRVFLALAIPPDLDLARESFPCDGGRSAVCFCMMPHSCFRAKLNVSKALGSRGGRPWFYLRLDRSGSA